MVLIIFIALAVVITVLALVAFFWPLRQLLVPKEQTLPKPADAEQQAEWQSVWNALAGQRSELDADADAATLSADAREESLREWASRADAALAAVQPEPVRSPRPLLRWALATAAGITMAAAVLYVWLGSPGAIEAGAQAQTSNMAATDPAAAHAESADAVQGMVNSLEAKLAAQPDNVSGWALLARSKGQLGDFPAAVAAYEQALKLAPHDPDLLTDAADVLAMAQGRNLQGRPGEMIAEALAVDPQHRKALALAASAAMQRGEKAQAVTFWRRLRATFAEGSEDAASIDQVLAQLGSGGISNAFAETVTATPAAAPPVQSAVKDSGRTTAGTGSRVTGTVEIAPALASKIAPGSMLFVYARAAASGAAAPRMPLAVLRLPVPAFPAQFMLDDSMAMAPGMNLSGATAVDIDARISASGQATPQPGDLRGRVLAVKPGASGLRIVIDSVQP